MSDFFDFIDAEIAQLKRLVPVPTGELGYGTDLSCVMDVTETLEEVDPNSVNGLGEALIRRLTTRRGSLPDDPDYGIDVAAFCNKGMTRQDLLALEGEIGSELRKDDRVQSTSTKVTWSDPRLDVRIKVVPEMPGVDPFSLTMAVEDGSVLFLEVSR